VGNSSIFLMFFPFWLLATPFDFPIFFPLVKTAFQHRRGLRARASGFPSISYSLPPPDLPGRMSPQRLGKKRRSLLALFPVFFSRVQDRAAAPTEATWPPPRI